MIRSLAVLAALAAQPACAGAVARIEAPAAAIDLGPGDIASVAASESPMGTPGVMVRLGDRATAEFSRLTEGAVGQRVRLIVCGKLRTAPVLRAPIRGGVVLFPAASVEDAVGMAAILRGDKACPDG